MHDLNVGTEIFEVTNTLERWVKENYLDKSVKALFDQGKYRLAPGYKQFHIEPTKFIKWSKERQNQHLERFLAFSAPQTTTYNKPSNAGLKGNEKCGDKRRINLLN